MYVLRERGHDHRVIGVDTVTGRSGPPIPMSTCSSQVGITLTFNVQLSDNRSIELVSPSPSVGTFSKDCGIARISSFGASALNIISPRPVPVVIVIPKIVTSCEVVVTTRPAVDCLHAEQRSCDLLVMLQRRNEFDRKGI